MIPGSADKRRQRRTKTEETLSGGSVQVLGQNMYYEAAGVSEYGPTILFVHESGGTGATWHGQLVGLAQHARCLVVDLPGHGRSEGTGFQTVREYRAAILAFLDVLAIRWPVVMAGVCLGAAIAVDLAVHAPDRVAGLVLAGISENGRACEQTRRQASLGEAPERFVQGLFSPSASPTLVDRQLQRWRLTSPVTRHGDLTAVREYPLRRALQALRHQILTVVGEADGLATAAVAADLTAGLPGRRVVTVPRAGCLSMMEQPALFNQTVAAYLDDLRPTGPDLPDLRKPGGYRRA